jgi:crotonobetainyl-CoA:carnitine CoA-transferase CaiB-like acyl-CoA transferase
MLDTMAWFVFPDTMKHRTFLDADTDGQGAFRDDSTQRSTIVATSDGHIVISPVSGAQIGRACDALGHPEWKAELKAITDPNQLANTMLDLAESVTLTDTSSHWCAVLEQADVPAAPVLDIDAHFCDAQVINNGVYSIVDNEDLGRQRMVRYPARFQDAELPLRPPPALGQNDGESW